MNAAYRISVVVPCPALDPPPRVLSDLAALVREGAALEILVATGKNPSRQRNLAVAEARGEILVFLDSDCRVGVDYLKKVSAHFRAGRDVVGGPVLLQVPATPRESLFQSYFAHPALTGPSSARYRASGTLRESTDAGLILCNLAVRRKIFLEVGGFEERLYPNEENEWMTRLRSAEHRLWYDPDLIVHRPQRKTWAEFARTMTGYGRGRTRQSLVSGRWDLPRQALAAGLLLALLALFLRPRTTLAGGLLGWIGYAAVLQRTSPTSPPISFAAALKAPSLPIFYAAGQVWGFFEGAGERPSGDVRVYRWRPGEPEEMEMVV